MGMKRMISLLLSALLLLTPGLSVAEGYDYLAGELTGAAISDSYVGGYQINVNLGFNVDEATAAALGDQMRAIASLMNKAQLQLSFYDDFGTARIRAKAVLDGVDVASADMIVGEDGSVQMVTSLTGNMALTLPAGTVTENGVSLPKEELVYTEETFSQLPAEDRLKITGSNMVSTLLNLLLGWVSATQMETEELYVFDYDTYIDATETRDAVSSRMIGTIRSTDLVNFLWSVVSHIRDKEYEFMDALAVCLGDMGVTRYDARRLADAIYSGPMSEPEAAAFFQPSSEILDNGAPITYQDVRYFLWKVADSLMDAWGHVSTENSSMIVSYDDFGQMVGFDAELVRFTESYPFQGNFLYSLRTDDYWQRLHTAHGELQVTDSQRIVGDLSVQQGEDVDGVNESHFIGQMDLIDQAVGSAMGFGVVSGWNYAIGEGGASEAIEGNADLMLNLNGESMTLVDASLSALTQTTDYGFVLNGQAQLIVPMLPQATISVNVESGDYDEVPFTGGQAVDLSKELTEAQLESIKSAAKAEAAGLMVKFALHPGVLADLMTLAGALGAE